MTDFKLDLLPGQKMHARLADMRQQQGDVAKAAYGGVPCYVILGYHALRDAFMDSRRFPGHIMYQHSIEQSIGRTFISMPDPEPHRKYRKLATPAFHSHTVANYENALLTDLAQELLDELESGLTTPDESAVDLVSTFTSRYPYLVISRLLGLTREQESQFHHWAMSLLLPELDPIAAKEARESFRAVTMQVIQARREEPKDDVISELIAADAEGRKLSDEEILSNVGLLFPTGGETTHSALGNFLYILLTNRNLWEQLCESPELIPMAISESLRMESSVAMLPRMSMNADQKYYGASIPANSMMLFSVAAANRDPKVFDRPNEFIIDREAKDTLEFGRGIKTCPGMHLARRNMTVAVSALLQRFPNATLLDEEDARPRGSAVRSPKSLRVALC